MKNEKLQKSGIWGILSVILAIINSCAGFVNGGGLSENPDPGIIVANIVGTALLWPMVMLGLFSIHKPFRNTKTQMKVFFFTSLVILVVNALALLVFIIWIIDKF